jgi:hypothetical protein
MEATQVREASLSDGALNTARRAVWAVCIVVYLTVFIGGIQAGGAELVTLGRATAFTLAAAVLGRMALGLMAGASLPIRQGPMAGEEGPLGSLVDLVSSANVAQQEDEAESGPIGER